MTYHTSKQSRYAAIPAVVALAVVAFTGGSVVSDSASAYPNQFTTVRNNSVAPTTEGVLSRKCRKAGGKFTPSTEKTNTYKCDVNRSDGGSTNVLCVKTGHKIRCMGKTETPK